MQHYIVKPTDTFPLPSIEPLLILESNTAVDRSFVGNGGEADIKYLSSDYLVLMTPSWKRQSFFIHNLVTHSEIEVKTAFEIKTFEVVSNRRLFISFNGFKINRIYDLSDEKLNKAHSSSDLTFVECQLGIEVNYAFAITGSSYLLLTGLGTAYNKELFEGLSVVPRSIEDCKYVLAPPDMEDSTLLEHIHKSWALSKNSKVDQPAPIKHKSFPLQITQLVDMRENKFTPIKIMEAKKAQVSALLTVSPLSSSSNISDCIFITSEKSANVLLSKENEKLYRWDIKETGVSCVPLNLFEKANENGLQPLRLQQLKKFFQICTYRQELREAIIVSPEHVLTAKELCLTLWNTKEGRCEEKLYVEPYVDNKLEKSGYIVDLVYSSEMSFLLLAIYSRGFFQLPKVECQFGQNAILKEILMFTILLPEAIANLIGSYCRPLAGMPFFKRFPCMVELEKNGWNKVTAAINEMEKYIKEREEKTGSTLFGNSKEDYTLRYEMMQTVCNLVNNCEKSPHQKLASNLAALIKTLEEFIENKKIKRGRTTHFLDHLKQLKINVMNVIATYHSQDEKSLSLVMASSSAC